MAAASVSADTSASAAASAAALACARSVAAARRCAEALSQRQHARPTAAAARVRRACAARTWLVRVRGR